MPGVMRLFKRAPAQRGSGRGAAPHGVERHDPAGRGVRDASRARLRRIVAEAVLLQDKAAELLAEIRDRRPLAELAPRGGPMATRFFELRRELPPPADLDMARQCADRQRRARPPRDADRDRAADALDGMALGRDRRAARAARRARARPRSGSTRSTTSSRIELPQPAHRLVLHAGGREPDRGDGRGGLPPPRARRPLPQLRGRARGARRRRPRRPRDGLGGLQLLDPAQGRGDRAPRRARASRPRSSARSTASCAATAAASARTPTARASWPRCGRSSIPAGSALVCSAPAARRARSRSRRRWPARARSRSSTATAARGEELAALVAERTPARRRVRRLGRHLRRARRRRHRRQRDARSGCSPTSTPASTSTSTSLRAGHGRRRRDPEPAADAPDPRRRGARLHRPRRPRHARRPGRDRDPALDRRRSPTATVMRAALEAL